MWNDPVRSWIAVLWAKRLIIGPLLALALAGCNQVVNSDAKELVDAKPDLPSPNQNPQSGSRSPAMSDHGGAAFIRLSLNDSQPYQLSEDSRRRLKSVLRLPGEKVGAEFFEKAEPMGSIKLDNMTIEVQYGLLLVREKTGVRCWNWESVTPQFKEIIMKHANDDDNVQVGRELDRALTSDK